MIQTCVQCNVNETHMHAGCHQQQGILSLQSATVSAQHCTHSTLLGTSKPVEHDSHTRQSDSQLELASADVSLFLQ
jgi:hypothetical protein